MIENPLTKQEIVVTPQDWKQVENMLQGIARQDRHSATVAQIACWNYASKVIDDTIKEEIENGVHSLSNEELLAHLVASYEHLREDGLCEVYTDEPLGVHCVYNDENNGFIIGFNDQSPDKEDWEWEVTTTLGGDPSIMVHFGNNPFSSYRAIEHFINITRTYAEGTNA